MRILSCLHSIHTESTARFPALNATNKEIKLSHITGRHDIAEIMLKLAKNTNQSINQSYRKIWKYQRPIRSCQISYRLQEQVIFSITDNSEGHGRKEMEPILSADDTWYIKYTIHPMTEPKLMAYIWRVTVS
jgi:hypothetical protein